MLAAHLLPVVLIQCPVTLMLPILPNAGLLGMDILPDVPTGMLLWMVRPLAVEMSPVDSVLPGLPGTERETGLHLAMIFVLAFARAGTPVNVEAKDPLPVDLLLVEIPRGPDPRPELETTMVVFLETSVEAWPLATLGLLLATVSIFWLFSELPIQSGSIITTVINLMISFL